MSLDGAEEYYLSANWSCDNAIFSTHYYTAYCEKINELKSVYNIDSFDKTEHENGESKKNEIVFYLYTENYTLLFEFTNDNDIDIGWYSAWLYYYDIEEGSEYSEFSHLVCFLNDMTNFVAYDTKSESNRFEELYNDAIENDKTFASDQYHFDDIVGSIHYKVDLDYNGGYYYMAEKSSIDKQCYFFEFEGLLKPQ